MSEKKQKRIKSLTVRFNREVLPFQHLRIEATSTVTKDDDADEVAEEVLSYLERLSCGMERRLYAKQLAAIRKEELAEQEKQQDNIPY